MSSNARAVTLVYVLLAHRFAVFALKLRSLTVVVGGGRGGLENMHVSAQFLVLLGGFSRYQSLTFWVVTYKQCFYFTYLQ